MPENNIIFHYSRTIFVCSIPEREKEKKIK